MTRIAPRLPVGPGTPPRAGRGPGPCPAAAHAPVPDAVPTPLPGSASRRPGTGSVLAGALVAAAALVAGCGGSGGASTPVEVAADEPAWVRGVMTDLYLYADRVPATVDLSGVTDAAGALEKFRVNPPDRFSYVDRYDRYAAFFDEGRAVGLGVGLRTLADALVLRFVQPGSPADAAGLRRGDRIIAIDGREVAALASAGTLNAALGPAEVGVTLRLEVERGGMRTTATVAKADYAVSPVLATRVLDVGGERIGYVALQTFSEPARAAWSRAIESVRAAGARSLVVDLRDNGGGRLHVAAEVAASLAPRAAIGDVFASLRHNARRAADDLTIALPDHPAAGAFDRVAWLVSDATCSASESLIAGLRPYRDDPVIGGATCGKPVGFEPRVRGDTVLSAVSFSSRNRDGLTDWFDGLPPTCTVGAEPYVAFGDPADPRLAAALHRFATGACPAAAPAAKAASPASEGSVPAARGVASESGHW